MSKKLSLEERLSLAASKKGKKKSKKNFDDGASSKVTSPQLSEANTNTSQNDIEAEQTILSDKLSSRESSIDTTLSIDIAYDEKNTRENSNVSSKKINSNSPDLFVENNNNTNNTIDDTIGTTTETQDNNNKGFNISNLNSSKYLKEKLPDNFLELTVPQLLKTLDDPLKSLLDKINIEISKNKILESSKTSDTSLIKLIKEKDDEIKVLQSDIKDLKKENKARNQEIKKKEKEISKLEGKNNSLKKEVHDQNEKNINLNSLNNDLKSQLDDVQADIRIIGNLRQENDNLNVKLFDKDDIINELNSNNENLQEKIASDFKIFEQEKALLNDENDSIKNTSQDQITQLELELENLRIQLDNVHKTSADDSFSNIEINENDEHLNKSPLVFVKPLSEKYSILQKEMENSRENWNAIELALQGKIRKLESETDEKAESLKKLHHSINESKVLIMNLNKNLDTIREENTDLKNSLTKYELQLKNLQNSKDDISEDYNLLKKKYEIQRATSEKKLTDQNASYNSLSTLDLIQNQDMKDTNNPIEDGWILNTSISQSSIKQNFDDSLPRIAEYKSEDNKSEDYNDLNNSYDNIGNSTMHMLSDNSLRMFTDLGDMPEDAGELQIRSRKEVPTAPQTPLSNTYNMRKPSTQIQGNNQMNAQMINRLGGEVRRMETELESLKEMCNRLSAEKEKSNDEILRLLEENEKFENVKNEKAKYETMSEELQHKLETSLQLLGEKTEQVEELRNDVSDLKEMLREQVEHMVELQQNR